LNELNHPIVEQSFAIIDALVGEHHLTAQEYAIACRVIHATADFEFVDLLKFSPRAIATGIACLGSKMPIITDVSMVREGIKTMVSKTFNNPIVVAVEQATLAEKGKTRTETGLLKCCQKYPEAIYVFGNAPTALLALGQQVLANKVNPCLVIGAPVGFVSVLEAKKTLANLKNIPQIRVEGNKGGSTVAAAIVNALLVLAYN
jgi:precorrin-8X/cobalt-precorrin-8 methylmutase